MTTRKTFRIRDKDCTGELLGTVRATGHTQAAAIYARRTRRGASANRETGTHGLSGIFSLRTWCKKNQASVMVGQVHVSEAI